MLTFNGVSTSSMSSLKKPTGFVNPTVTAVTGDILWQWPNTLRVDRATVATTSRKTTLENILNDVTVGLNKQCEDIVSQLDTTTNDVEAYAELLDNGSNLDSIDPSSDFYLDANDEYVCPVIIYVKVTPST